MLNQYKPIIITLSIMALIIIATIQYVQSLINQPIDLSIQNNKLELLDSKTLDNIVIPKEFEFKGAKIALAWTDDNTGEDLIIQSDKKIYNGFNNIEVYFSITNINKQGQEMDVVVWVGDERIRVEEMERIDTEDNVHNTLALSAAAALSARTDRKDIKGFTCGNQANDSIKSGQTNYYKATIKYPPMSKGEFFIEAFGKDTECPIGHSVSCGTTYGHLDPWYNSNWSYWKKITINSSQIATTTSNFPVLATSTDSDLRTIANGGHVGNDNGYDIVFAGSDGETLLNFEKEKYASTTGEIVYWIKTDISSTTDKMIYMYYGNASASDLATTTGVWDDNFVMVQHLQETDIDNDAGDIKDSTKYANDGTTYTMDTSDQVAGQIDGSLDFDGEDDYVLHSSISFADAAPHTYSTWLKWNGGVVSGHVVPFGNGANWWYAIYFAFGGLKEFKYYTLTTIESVTGVDTTVLFDGEKHQVVWTVASDRLVTVYIDGIFNEDETLDTTDQIYASIARGFGVTGYDWNGFIDEVRISNVARTAGWIETEYNNQVSVGSFMSFGEEVCLPKPVERSGGENIKAIIKGGTRIKGGVRF